MKARPLSKKDVKLARDRVAIFGGSVHVHERHITLFNVNGDIWAYAFPIVSEDSKTSLTIVPAGSIHLPEFHGLFR